MANNNPALERYFRRISSDMLRRINEYKKIREIENSDLRREKEMIFLQQQKAIIGKFIENEGHTRRMLERGLERQQQDIQGWWKRNIGFRRVKSNCLDRFDNLMHLAKKVKQKLDSSEFQQINSQVLISEIENEVLTIIHLSDNYEIKRHAQELLEHCRRSKSLIASLVLLTALSALAVYTYTNYHIIPVDSQTTQVRFIADDMASYDWAQGVHYSYGFHTMMDNIIKHKSALKGLQYKIKDDQRFGNQAAKIISITKGASALLPSDIKRALGEDIVMEIQALNKGEIVITIYKENEAAIDIVFIQDKAGRKLANTHNFSDSQLEAMYHTARQGVEHLINTN